MLRNWSEIKEEDVLTLYKWLERSCSYIKVAEVLVDCQTYKAESRKQKGFGRVGDVLICKWLETEECLEKKAESIEIEKQEQEEQKTITLCDKGVLPMLYEWNI